MQLKRVFDIVFSLMSLLCFFPLFFLIAFLIKNTSKGPIFYRCLRVGKNGKMIYCWKFRTMEIDAEERLRNLLQENPQLREEWEIYAKLKNDPRVHRFGKFLRKSSLDELPQLWNILKGDLSVVGPRPVTKEEVDKYFKEKASKILSVRPGLTGIWQTSGRSLLSFEERLCLEEKYIDERSFILDIWIICKTIPLIFSSKGAF